MPSVFQNMADYLIEGYWSSAEKGARGGARKFDNQSLTVHWNGLQDSDKILAQEALDYWSAVSGLSFNNTTVKSDADIVLRNGNQQNQAWAWSKLNTDTGSEFDQITKSTVTISADWTPISGPIDGPEDFLGSYRFGTFVHEIGHALGLGHQGKYNGGSPRPKQILFDEDSLQYSAMSYIAHPNIHVRWNMDTTTIPGIVDILAMQQIYGSNGVANPGDTLYGKGSTASQAGYDADYLRSTMLTIFDTGGDHDRLNFRGTGHDQSIHLKAGVFSDVYGREGNVVIALGVVIEHATGGNGDDIISGNSAGNTLNGLAGLDVINGGRGGDILLGKSGADRLSGDNGHDLIIGGIGDDHLTGGNGRDTFKFRNAFGNDTISDFTVGQDRLDLGSLEIDQNISFVDGSNFHLQFAGGQSSIMFENLDVLLETPALGVSDLIDLLT